MLDYFKLLLPALIPSWRFFDVIAPSPRIEFSLLKHDQDKSLHWQEFRPRPTRLSIGNTLKRMIWNPEWNETLFLVSCAERLAQDQTDHSKEEIAKRLKEDLKQRPIDKALTPYFQFRLVFVGREDEKIEEHIAFISDPEPLDESV